ncbi:type 2 isopentenyl-diphosphate Delta-isomerase [candidate division KSB1 bacterium]|nr:type 2 isopentenyl-diphosphate Delta-isomerase [candidate division KSB1 bacterium]
MKDITAHRKAEHVAICLQHDVQYQQVTTGFEKIRLVHCALPESDYRELVTEVEFLKKKLAFPLMISAMTGGFDAAKDLNQQLAEVCNAQQVALGLGSLRQAIENSDYWDSFQIVRRRAPDIPIIGNIGGAQVIHDSQRRALEKLLSRLEFDALAIHLNPLQEILQPEGDQNFKGILKGIESLVHHLPIPIIVKETGAGISGAVAARLKNVGVTWVDVSGAGGTSWAAVEYYRSPEREITAKFWDWGIPTAQCLAEVSKISSLQIIASGGIRSGIDMAKACVLGACLTGAAMPFLKALSLQKPMGLIQTIEAWKKEFRIVMFLTGCHRVDDLKNVSYQIIA